MNHLRISMKTILCALAGAGALALGGCSRPADASAKNFGAALTAYLAKRGDLCLAKNHWPIDVTEREIEAGARNAVQLPVLARLGLVESTVAEVDRKDDDDQLHHMKVRRYLLTEAGRKYYILRNAARPDGTQAPQGDLCAAKLSLDKVVRWEEGATAVATGSVPRAPKQMVVTYTYKVEPAPWTRDAEAQKVFPVVAGVVRGAGSAQLQETLSLTPSGWVAVDLLPGS